MPTNFSGLTHFSAWDIAKSDQSGTFNCDQCLSKTNPNNCNCYNQNPEYKQNCLRCRCQSIFQPTGQKTKKVSFPSQNQTNTIQKCTNCGTLTYDTCSTMLNNSLKQDLNVCSQNTIVSGEGNIVRGNRMNSNCAGSSEDGNPNGAQSPNTIAGIPLPFNLSKKEVEIGGAGTAVFVALLLLL